MVLNELSRTLVTPVTVETAAMAEIVAIVGMVATTKMVDIRGTVSLVRATAADITHSQFKLAARHPTSVF
jgi:hypothetical protein